MRKLALAAATAVVAATFVACGNGTPKANLKTDIDSVSYAIGMDQSQGLKEYLANGLGVDTAYMDDFFRGLNEAVKAGDNKSQNAYWAGHQIGQTVRDRMIKGLNSQLFGSDSTQTISVDNFLAGFITAVANKPGLMTPEQSKELAQRLMKEIHDRNLEKEFAQYKDSCDKYVADYAKQAGVQKLPSGVLYKVIKQGTGAVPNDSSVVKVNYEGKTIDGNVFDSSYQRKQPASFPANRVIEGWKDALTHMPVGSTWEVVVPQDKAYGANAQGAIKPFSALTFKIELLGIEK